MQELYGVVSVVSDEDKAMADDLKQKGENGVRKLCEFFLSRNILDDMQVMPNWS